MVFLFFSIYGLHKNLQLCLRYDWLLSNDYFQQHFTRKINLYRQVFRVQNKRIILFTFLIVFGEVLFCVSTYLLDIFVKSNINKSSYLTELFKILQNTLSFYNLRCFNMSTLFHACFYLD